MTRSPIASALLRWYAAHARDLPWRSQSSPYRVWISEIMLQQTRVDAVVPFYERWMRLFPDVQTLAAASERDVLIAWEGLGYYARARNLRGAAKLIVSRYSGRLPDRLEELRSLPGVGRYTAAAIASMAFGVDEPVLDGNVRRVLARYFDLRLPADSGAGLKRLWLLARQHLPPGRAADYNQALMDLGATVCLPRNPHCSRCPLRKSCSALRLGTVDRRPILRLKRPTPLYHVGTAVVMRRGRVLLAHRSSKGLLAGLWEFPNARLKQVAKGGALSYTFATALKHSYGLHVRPDGLLCELNHAYTHFRVHVEAHSCHLLPPIPSRRLDWVPLDELPSYPMGKVDRQVAREIARLESEKREPD